MNRQKKILGTWNNTVAYGNRTPPFNIQRKFVVLGKNLSLRNTLKFCNIFAWNIKKRCPRTWFLCGENISDKSDIKIATKENWLKWEERMYQNPKYRHSIKIYTEVSKEQSWQNDKPVMWRTNLRNLPRMLYSEFRNVLVASNRNSIQYSQWLLCSKNVHMEFATCNQNSSKMIRITYTKYS